MGNYSSSKLCEDDPDLYEEDSSEITTSGGIIDVCIHRFIAHPFVVLRRQCQVNAWSRRPHYQPASLLPVVYRLIQKHRWESLFKGVHAVVILDFSTFVCEVLVSVYSGLPSYALHHQDTATQAQYYGIKFLTASLMGPMYAAAVQATVQTFRGTNLHNAVDFLVSAAQRYTIWQIPGSGHPLRRTMPVWIIGPLYGAYVVSKLFIASSVQWRLFIWLKHRKEKQMLPLPDVADNSKRDLHMSSYLTTSTTRISSKGTIGHHFRRYEARAIALIIADVLLYPMETVLNRLCIQGTKVSIDNLDTGVDAIPTIFSYRSPFQCVGNIMKAHGVGGFYKGIGALGIQAIVYLGLFGGIHFALTYFELDNHKTPEKE